MTEPALPILDISKFRGTTEQREEFLNDLRDAAHNVGFFYIVGHGVPESVTTGVMDAAREFFAQIGRASCRERV